MKAKIEVESKSVVEAIGLQPVIDAVLEAFPIDDITHAITTHYSHMDDEDYRKALTEFVKSLSHEFPNSAIIGGLSHEAHREYLSLLIEGLTRVRDGKDKPVDHSQPMPHTPSSYWNAQGLRWVVCGYMTRYDAATLEGRYVRNGWRIPTGDELDALAVDIFDGSHTKAREELAHRACWTDDPVLAVGRAGVGAAVVYNFPTRDVSAENATLKASCVLVAPEVA